MHVKLVNIHQLRKAMWWNIHLSDKTCPDRCLSLLGVFIFVFLWWKYSTCNELIWNWPWAFVVFCLIIGWHTLVECTEVRSLHCIYSTQQKEEKEHTLFGIHLFTGASSWRAAISVACPRGTNNLANISTLCPGKGMQSMSFKERNAV